MIRTLRSGDEEEQKLRTSYYLHAALLVLRRGLRGLRLGGQWADVGLHEPMGEDRETGGRVDWGQLLERLP